MTILEAMRPSVGAPSAQAAPVSAYSLAVAAVAYVALLVAKQALLNDPDTLWHIAAGRWIRLHHAVPTIDPFSHTLLGQPWTAHEWLAETVLAGTYDQFGWTGIVLASAIAGAMALGLLAYALLRFIAPKYVFIVVAFSFLLAAAHTTARPHLLAMPLMVAWVAGLVIARAQDRGPSLWLLPVMALWANLHGGFIVGLGVAGVLAAEAVWMAPQTKRAPVLKTWAPFLGGAALASLATPHGISGWLFPFQLMSLGFSLNYVNEWHAPDFTTFQPVELWLAGLAALFVFVRPRLSLFRWALLAGLVYMALTHVRNAELLALIAPLVLAEPVARAVGAPELPAVRGAAFAEAAALIVMLGASLFIVARGVVHEDPKIMPIAALEAAERANLRGPVFNDYDFGGYLIFSGVPVFVDGRVDLYRDAFMRDYMAARLAEPGTLEKELDRYRVGWTLLAPETPAAKALDKMPGWTRVYADGSAVVHRRTTP